MRELGHRWQGQQGLSLENSRKLKRGFQGLFTPRSKQGHKRVEKNQFSQVFFYFSGFSTRLQRFSDLELFASFPDPPREPLSSFFLSELYIYIKEMPF